MATPPDPLAKIIRNENKIARAWLRSVQELKDGLSIPDLATAITLGAQRNADQMLPRDKIIESMQPVRELIIESSMLVIGITGKLPDD